VFCKLEDGWLFFFFLIHALGSAGPEKLGQWMGRQSGGEVLLPEADKLTSLELMCSLFIGENQVTGGETAMN
jgi:hypothetical protein